MTILYPLIISLIAGLSTSLGVILIYFKINQKREDIIINICLTIAFLIMLYISIFDLIPNGLLGLIKNNSLLYTIIVALITFNIGLLLIIIITRFNKSSNSLYQLGLISMFSLMMHNIPEGIITFMTNLNHNALGINLALSIMFHNIPEGICIAIPIYFSTNSRTKALLYTLIAGLSEPLGGLLFYLLFKAIITPNILNICLLFVSGLMISLCFKKIIPEIKKINKIQGVLYGFIIGLLIISIMHIFN